MPVTKADIPEWMKDMPDKAKTLYVSVYNDSYNSNPDLDEGKRIAKAAAAAKAAVHSAGYQEKVKARSYAKVVSLSGLVFETKPGKETPEPTWVDVCKVGNWVDSEKGIVELTKEMFQKIIKNFKAGVLGFLPNLNWQHSDTKDDLDPPQDDRSAGKITDLRMSGDVLEGLIDWSAEGYTDAKNKAFTYLSALIYFNFADRNTGAKVGPVLWSAALTNTPFITGLAPIALSWQASAYLKCSVSRDREIAALFDALDRTFGYLNPGIDGMGGPSYDLVEWFEDKVVVRKDRTLYMAPYTYSEKGDTCVLGDFEEATYMPKKSGAKIKVPQMGMDKSKTKGGEKRMREKLISALQAAESDEEAFKVVESIVKEQVELRNKPTDREIALKAELEVKNKALRANQIQATITALRTPSGGKAFAPATVDMLEALLKAEGEGVIKLAEGKEAHSFMEGLAMCLQNAKDTGMVNLTGAQIASGTTDNPQAVGQDDGSTLVLKMIVPTAEEREVVLTKTLGSASNESRKNLEAGGAVVDEESIVKEVACLRAMRQNPAFNHQAAWNLVKRANYGKG